MINTVAEPRTKNKKQVAPKSGGEYQALQPPKIAYEAGSHELLATGTTKLTKGVENTAGKQ